MDVISQVTDREIPKAIDISGWLFVMIDPHVDELLIAVAAFAPLLKAQRNFILAIPQKTFTYGATERHKVFKHQF